MVIARGAVHLDAGTAATAIVGLAAVAVDNLHDELLGLGCGLSGSDKIDRAQTIDTLGLTGDVDMAATPLLKVTNSFTSTANNQADSSIGHHNLHDILTLSKCGRGRSSSGGGRSIAVTAASTMGVVSSGYSAHARVFNDPVDGILGLSTSCTRAGDSALTERTLVIRASDELHSATGGGLNTTQVLTLSSNDQAH